MSSPLTIDISLVKKTVKFNMSTQPPPNYEWDGTKIRFQNPDGTWGLWVDLQGKEGREIELRKSDTYIQWRYVGDATWIDLIAISELKGDSGHTPYIQDGYWYINDINTGVKAEGSDGKDGAMGVDGKSAYQIAVDNGFIGTETEWLDSLKGASGASGYTPYIENGYWYINGTNTGVVAEGQNGATPEINPTTKHWIINGVDTGILAQGTDGTDGTNGESAYQIALNNGFVGSEQEWLESLNGTNGTNGYTPYIQGGYWYINGVDTGVKAEGVNGANGYTPYIEDGYWFINGVSTNVKAEGVDGVNGKSAYEIAVENGFVGTEEQWLESLKATSLIKTSELILTDGGVELNAGVCQWIGDIDPCQQMITIEGMSMPLPLVFFYLVNGMDFTLSKEDMDALYSHKIVAISLSNINIGIPNALVSNFSINTSSNTKLSFTAALEGGFGFISYERISDTESRLVKIIDLSEQQSGGGFETSTVIQTYDWVDEGGYYKQTLYLYDIDGGSPIIDLDTSFDPTTAQAEMAEWAKVYKIYAGEKMLEIYATEPTTVPLNIIIKVV